MVPVLISIHSTAYRDDSTNTDTMQLLVPGVLELSEDESEAVLRYEESVDTEAIPQKVTLTVTDETITVNREGVYSSLLYFKLGSTYQTTYHLPVGDMELTVYCTRFKVSLDAGGGEIFLRYQLDINGQFAAMHEMELVIFPSNESRATV